MGRGDGIRCNRNYQTLIQEITMNVRKFICTAAVVVGVLGIAYAADENPLADAKAGEWTLAMNKISYPGGSMTNYTYSYVTKVDGKKITVVTQSLKEDGKTGMMAGQPAEIDLDKKGEGEAKGPKPKISDEEIDVKGKKVKCKKTETENETNGVKSTSIVWMSNEI